MAAHKKIDRICCAVLILSLIVTILFMNGEALGLQASAATLGYETRLFDTTRVHTIDIVMDDWDTFIEGCEDEEYEPCAVVIDGESYKCCHSREGKYVPFLCPAIGKPALQLQNRV